jgi:hypothetical protein
MTATKLARIIAVLSSILIVACRSESPSEPACRVDRDSIKNISSDAVCVVRVGDLMLTVHGKGSQKLTLPIGRQQPQERAQCTAHRAAWEKTGFNLEVNKLLGEDKHGLQYYRCELDAGFTGKIKDFPLPDWSKNTTSKILLIDPFVTTNNEWHESVDLIFVRNMFNKASTP